jgi:anthranilate phosphoribosyltransferase
MDGVDELSLAAPSVVWDVRAGRDPQQSEVKPEDVGLDRAERNAIAGGTVTDNVQIVRGILGGEIDGPRRDVVLFNAAAALVAAEQAQDLREGVERAREAIANGNAYARLERMVRASRDE